MWGVPRSAWLVVALGAAASASCFNPVHSDAVNALGGEGGGVGPGPSFFFNAEGAEDRRGGRRRRSSLCEPLRPLR